MSKPQSEQIKKFNQRIDIIEAKIADINFILEAIIEMLAVHKTIVKDLIKKVK